MIRQAHELGVRVLLKPHIWLRPPRWVGEIEQRSDQAWRVWFSAYGEFILHYARVASDTGVDALSIGNELERATMRVEDWRRLIRDIRHAYGGPLTYGAGFEEVYRVGFWDALDFIGVSAYFPLVTDRPTDRPALIEGWQPHITRLRDLSARWQRTIVFTELGYPSADHAAERPWESNRAAPVNLELQAEAYEAFYQAVWNEPWLGGVYWWKWFSTPDHGGSANSDHVPRNKPAERVIARYWSGDVSSPTEPGTRTPAN